MRIALLAGEPSGDNLGAGLMAALRKRFPQARFEGIGGERMIAQGLQSLFPLEALSVMGLVEVLGHLPTLVRIRWAVFRHFVSHPPDVFIGIDAPDFNLSLEHCLKSRGIPTVHFVSPQVWAWRKRRVRRIGRSVDLMLTLLPFEADFYRTHRVPVAYVGHPFADEIPLQCDRPGVRRTLGLGDPSGGLVALLPGSRMAEVGALGPLFVDTARWLAQRKPGVAFIVPAATARVQRYVVELLAQRAPELPVTVLEGQARDALAAADATLISSGTATLEALLSRCPMVVAYRVAPLSAWIATKLIDVPWFSLPNLLAGRNLVQEFIQDAATVENLGPAMLALLNDPPRRAGLEGQFVHIHEELRRDANQQAAAAVAGLLTRGGSARG
jgi:lipid-A-disaccharide synthase